MNAETIAALERAARLFEVQAQNLAEFKPIASEHVAQDAALILALIDTLRAGEKRAFPLAIKIDDAVPPGEVHFKHPDGRVDKLVNCALAIEAGARMAHENTDLQSKV